jgi:regulatory protein
MPIFADDPQQRRAVAAALAILARRDHTEAELARKLSQKGFDQAACDAAAARCRELGYLDDARTARALLASLRRRGLGIHRIRCELRDKGVPEAAIADLTARDDDLDQALEAARVALDRKRPALAREPDPAKHRARIYRFLLSRGFSSEVARRLAATSE